MNRDWTPPLGCRPGTNGRDSGHSSTCGTPLPAGEQLHHHDEEDGRMNQAKPFSYPTTITP
ncbi:MAG TPA: hypothetical protein PK545_03840, partial [Deltaproteobacteria bacterium]|nr:hypothetical protein [Deltaproteobacteria bacterium]